MPEGGQGENESKFIETALLVIFWENDTENHVKGISRLLDSQNFRV